MVCPGDNVPPPGRITPAVADGYEIGITIPGASVILDGRTVAGVAASVESGIVVPSTTIAPAAPDTVGGGTDIVCPFTAIDDPGRIVIGAAPSVGMITTAPLAVPVWITETGTAGPLPIVMLDIGARVGALEAGIVNEVSFMTTMLGADGEPAFVGPGVGTETRIPDIVVEEPGTRVLPSGRITPPPGEGAGAIGIGGFLVRAGFGGCGWICEGWKFEGGLLEGVLLAEGFAGILLDCWLVEGGVLDSWLLDGGVLDG